MNQVYTPLIKQWLILLALTIGSTLVFEHSQLDVRISELFYSNGDWLLEKGGQPYAFILYDFPKALLILMIVALLVILILRCLRRKSTYTMRAKTFFIGLVTTLSNREIGYLLVTLIAVPTIIASLKAVTHVSCPNNLALFNGALPYLSIWQNIVANTEAKCFPAAHASAGFALYGFAYLPTLKRHRVKIIILTTILGWTMGMYKMLIGDHFFSHTLVSMLLSWTLACGFAMIFFAKSSVKKPALLKVSV